MPTRIQAISGKQKRRNQRLEIPTIYLGIEGYLYPSIDWGFGGFCLKNYRGPLRVGDPTVVSHAGMTQDELAVMGTWARVVRADGNGHLAAEFVGLSNDAFDVLQSFMMHRVPRNAIRREAS